MLKSTIVVLKSLMTKPAHERCGPSIVSLRELKSTNQGGARLMAGRRETALPVSMHEAGHALASLVTQPYKDIEAMWIEETPDGWGGKLENGSANWQEYFSVVTAEVRPHVEVGARCDCIVYLAGPVAEARWVYRTRFAVSLLGHQIGTTIGDVDFKEGSDLARVKRRLEWIDPAAMTANFFKLWDHTEALIAKHWRQTLELGRLLAKRKRLEDDEIYAWWEGHCQ